MDKQTSVSLRYSQLLGAFLVLLTVLFSLNCGGGGGGSTESSTEVISSDQTVNKGEALVQIDLADFEILQNRQKTRLAGSISDVQTVTLSIKVDGSTLLQDFELTHVTGTIYQATIQNLPIGKAIQLEITAKDSQGEVVIKTVSETTLDENSANDEMPEISIPFAAVVEFQGEIITQSEIENLIETTDVVMNDDQGSATDQNDGQETVDEGQNGNSESDTTQAVVEEEVDPVVGLLRADALGEFYDKFSINYKAYFSENDLIIRDANKTRELVKMTALRFGRESNLQDLESPILATSPTKVSYAYSGIEAWYKPMNDGLEQGFTLNTSPDGDGEVCVDIAVVAEKVTFRGDAFFLETGGHIFNYDKLLVYDATGQTLNSSFKYDESGFIRITFDDEGAVYPVVVDPAITAVQIQLLDDNNDGIINTIVINYDENITSGNNDTTGWTVNNNGNGVTINSVQSSANQFQINLDAADVDLGIDTAGSGIEVIYDANAGSLGFASGNVADNILTGDSGGDDTEVDFASPILYSVDFTQLTAPAGTDLNGHQINAIQLVYSESVTVHSNGMGGGDVGVGNNVVSSNAMGSMFNANGITGLFDWSGGGLGDMRNASHADNRIEHASANVVNIYLNSQNSAYFLSGSTAPSNPTTISANSNSNYIEDASGYAVNSAATTTVNNSVGWDVAIPTVAQIYSLDLDNDGMINAVDVTFSDNMLDASFTPGSYELDNDQTNNGVGEATGNVIETGVSFPSVVNVADDEYGRLYVSAEITGSENVFLHHNTAGARDLHGNRIATGDDLGVANDRANPVILSADFTQAAAPGGSDLAGENLNAIVLIYSEEVLVYTDGAATTVINSGAYAASTTTQGSMATSNLITGLISWAALNGGDMSGNNHADNVVEHTSANTLTVFVNGEIEGFFNSGSTAPTNPVVTSIVDTGDLVDVAGLPASGTDAVAVTNSIAWNVDSLTISDVYSRDTDDNGQIDEVDITFSTNVRDATINASKYEIDLDNSNDGSNEVLANAVSTSVLFPSTDNDANDEYINLTLTSELNTTANVFLHQLTMGARDVYGNPVASGSDLGNAVDRANPVLLSVDFYQGVAPGGSDLAGNTLNAIQLIYSENVLVYTDGSGGGTITNNNSAQSTSATGSMSQANLISGLFSWNTTNGGDLVGDSDTSNYVERVGANVINIYLNTSNSAGFSSGSAAPTTPTVEAIVDSNDLTDLVGLTPNIGATTTVTNSIAWDVSRPTIYDVYAMDSNDDGDIDSVDLVYSENILYASVTLAHYELDNDSNNNGSGEVTPTAKSTSVSNPGSFTANDDQYLNFTLGTPITGSENVFLHVITLGTRDIYGNRLQLVNAAGNAIDVAEPVLLTADFTTLAAPSGTELAGNVLNAVSLVYSENVQVFTNGAGGGAIADGSAAASTATQGSMATANLITGLISWTGGLSGDMAVSSDTVNTVEHSQANTINIYMNSYNSGYFSSGTTAPTTPVVSAIRDANDLTDAAGLAANDASNPTESNSNTWDVTSPTLLKHYSLDTDLNGNIDAVDLTFSENVVDASFILANFEIDNDFSNNVTGEVNPNSSSTTINQPSNDTDANDDGYRFVLNPQIGGTDLVAVHNITLGMRDAAGNPLAISDNIGTGFDKADPLLLSVDFTQLTAPVGTNLAGNLLNSMQLAYSENVLIHTDGAGGTDISNGSGLSSTATLGSMTQANLITGLFSWNTTNGGDLTGSAQTINYVELSSGNLVNIYLNTSSSGYFNAGSTAPTTPTVEAIRDANDVQDSAGMSVNVMNTVTVTNSIAWEVSQPLVQDVYALDTDNDGDIDSVDLVFSENILDDSVTLIHYELDNDSNNNGSGEVNPTAQSTSVTNPSAINQVDDPYLNFTLGTQISGSENVFLHVVSLGTRDLYGNRLATIDAAGNAIDAAQPVLLTVDFTTMSSPTGTELAGNVLNSVSLLYSENIQVFTNGAGGAEITTGNDAGSTATQGSMATANLMTGLISWATLNGGDMVGSSDTVNTIEHSLGNTVNVYLNSYNSGYFSAGTTAPTTPAVSAIEDANDLTDVAGLAANPLSNPTESNSNAWDVVQPSLENIYSFDLDIDGQIDAVDLSFSENIIDASVVLGNFEVDDDSVNNGVGEVVPNAFDTEVSLPTADTDSSDNVFRFTLNPEVSRTDEVYIHNNTLGLRDAAGNPLAVGNNLGTSNDTTQPVLLSVDFTQLTAPAGSDLAGNTLNAIQAVYSENVIVHRNGSGGSDLAAGASSSTTNTMGSMAQARTVEGLFSWAALNGGDLAGSDNTINHIELASSENVINIYLNSSNSGYFETGSVAPTTPVVTAVSDVNDLEDSAGLSANNMNTVTVTNSISWDSTAPTVLFNYSLDNDADGDVESFDLVFSDNILDASFTAANFSFDDDAANLSGNEKTVTSGNSFVMKPSVDNDANDEYFHMELTDGNELVGSEAGYLHHNILGLRDIVGNRLSLGDALGTEIDCAGPALLSVNFSTGASPATSDMGGNTVNTMTFGYSENIIISNNYDGGDDIAVGATSSSSNTLGDMTTVRDLKAFVTWNAANGGAMVNNGETDNVVEHTTDNTITVYFNANLWGYYASGTSSPSATPTINTVYSDNLNIRDASFVAVNSESNPAVSVTAAVNASVWDVTKPSIQSVSPGTGGDISTYDIRTPDVTFSENVTFATNTEFWTIDGNGSFLVGATDAMFTIDTVALSSGNATYEITFNETTDRWKAGEFEIGLNHAVRDDAGNQLNTAANSFTYTVEVDNVALYEFEASDTTDEFNSWTSGTFNPVLSGGSSANLTSTGWGIDGHAMNLYGTESFTIDGLDYHGFPQNAGTVAFWYWVPNTPSINDIVFGDQNVAGGNALTIRYTGSDNTYRVAAHGVPAGNTLDFNMYLGSYNHIGLKYDHDNNLRLYLNGQRLSNLITTGEWFPNDQKVIWQPNGTIDHVWLNDVARSEANIQYYFIPLTEASYTFDSGNVTNDEVLDETNDYLGTIYGSANIVEGHHLTGNAVHLQTASMGFRPEDYGRHLFPHIDTGTLQFWVNPGPVDGVNINLFDEPDASRDHFYIEGTGNIAEYQFIIQSSAGGAALGSSTFTLQDQAWNHIGVTWDVSGNLDLYVNGSANYQYTMPGGWSLGTQIVGTTPRGYFDDLAVTDNVWTATNFQNLFDTYHITKADYSFDEEAATLNTPWLNTNDVGINYTTDTSGNHHRMFFHGVEVPTLDKPHYGDIRTAANSIQFSGNSGFSVYSLESDFFPSQDGAYIWWWKPSFETGGNTVEVLDTDDGGRDHFVIKSLDNDGNFEFYLRDTTGTYSANYTFNPIMERWNHLSIVWTSNSSDHGGNRAAFHLNGSEVWNQDIGTWRPVDQKTASTPYGSLDNFRVRNTPFTAAEVLDEYDDYIRNIEEFSGTNTIVFGFSDGEFEATNSHDVELLYDVDTVNASQNPPAHGRFNAIHQSTTGHHGYYDDVDRTNTLDTFDTGAQEFEEGESIWAPVLEKARFPQDEGTLRFWYQPVYEYGDIDVVFGGNFIDSNNHENFFVIEETSTQGFYDFNIYEDGVLLGGLTGFEMHRNTFNYVAVTWRSGDEVDLYINGVSRDATTMGTWRPSDQLFVSTPNGVLDMLYLEDVQRDADFINDYFITYVTATGFYTFEMDTLPDIVDQSGNFKDASEYGAGVIVNSQGFDASSSYYLDLTAANSYLDIPGLIKDLFPQDEGVVRFWYDPAISSDNNTYVYDAPDLSRNHFYIQSQTEEGYYRFAIQSDQSSDNLAGFYDFYLDPRDWNLVSFNWSDDEDKINFMVNGKVLYTTQMGTWRPSKQISVSTPNGLLDDFYISYIYESTDEIEDYFHSYKPKMNASSMQVWGNGSQYRLGHGVASITDTPYINNNTIRVTTTAGGSTFGVAILENTKMVTWGANDLGQLGHGSTSTLTIPTEIELWNGFDDVDAGEKFVIATLVNGNVVGWGDNSRNQLGFTSAGNTFETSPYIFGNINDIIAVACGNSHVLAMNTNGDVYAWGANDYGQCGVNPSTATVTAPQLMAAGGGTPSPVQIDCGFAHSLIRYDDGSVVAYGLNGNGQLGDGTTTDSFTGVTVGLSSAADDIASGDEFNLALLNTGAIESWGKNDNGQLGGGDTTLSSNSNPVKVKLSDGTELSNVRDVAASSRTGYAIVSGNTAYSFGYGLEGQLGNGTRDIAQEFASIVVGVTDLDSLGKPGSAHATPLMSRSSYYDSFAEIDVAYIFDDEDFTDLGSAQFDGRHFGSPTVGIGRASKGLAYHFEDEEYFSVPDLSGNAFPQYEGTYSFWYKATSSTPTGANVFDEPDISRDHFHMEYQGSGNIDLVMTNGGLESTLATYNVTLDDWHFLAFTWQTNSSSLTITNNASASSSFVAFGSWLPEDQIVISTPVGWLDNIKITSDFSEEDDLIEEYVFGGNSSAGEYVKAWGANSSGELGDGTTVNQFTPIDVTEINNPTKISVGLGFKIALYPDGSMKGIGENSNGQLGDGTTIDRYDTVDVINNKGTVVDIASGRNFSIGLLADGNVIGWGNNSKGQLGVNSSVSHFVDARLVSGLTNVTQIAVGYGHVLALSGGNVYAWGDNNDGQLGNGGVSFERAPTLIASLSNVDEISAGRYHSLARVGTEVYAWGQNLYGQVGDGSTNNSLFPSRVDGALLGQNVTSVYAGGRFNVAIVDGTDIYLWGSAFNNSLSYTPTYSETVANISDIGVGWDHFVILLNTGTLMAWGDNSLGQLGLGDSSITSVSSLTAIPSLDTILTLTVIKDSNFVVGQ